MSKTRTLLLWLTFTAGGGWCQGISKSSDYYPLNGNGNGNGEKGLFPSVFNLAADADISANATCGQNEPEIYCKLVEHVYVRAPQCGVCDDKDPEHRHPISNAIDGTNSWWQSPTLQNGRRYEFVTITLDLKQVFQVAYVIIKTGISPRPGNWILERSVDGVTWKPWQYYAASDSECISRYGVEPREGKPTYQSDSEVICTSFYSKLNPLEDGEIHTSLVTGRPGASLPSEELLNFTLARYVRLRLQKIRTLNADLMSLSTGIRNASALAQTLNSPENDRSLYRRLFYSIKDISIGGQCVCFGHAATCPFDPDIDRPICSCEHNTCGESCDRCCPLYNQRPWRAGTSNDSGVCEQCQCFGHAKECYYNEQVDRENKSLNINNIYSGGGVCLNCTDFTTGINCEQCIDGYYRPTGVRPNARQPCLPCSCSAVGSVGHCVKDSSLVSEGLQPGQCICKEGYAGSRCEKCAKGFRGYPNCEPCPCNVAGIVDTSCSTPCQCKANVEGERCDFCKAGYFDLQESNPEGCSKCFCFDRSGRCVSSDLGIMTITTKKGWLVTDLLGRRVVSPYMESSRLLIANDDMADFESYYWLAPADYVGKKLTAYAQTMKFHVSWVQARGDTGGKATKGPDVIMEGSGMKIGYGDRSYRENNATITWILKEKGWYHIPDTVQDIARKRRTEYKGEAVTKMQFMTIINDLQRLMIRAKFHTDQIEGVLHDVEMEIGAENSLNGELARGIEQCTCPPGYTGLSCEECDFGFVRLNQTRGQFECIECNCNRHAATCDLDLGTCGPCLHNTVGPNCELCAPGYYGDARTGRPDSCKRCRCPLEISSNNFSPTCVSTGVDNYVCDQCPVGYEGSHCERCSDGYFGNPLIPGSYCQPCNCNQNHEIGASDWCDRLTGQCLKCKPGTTGASCELCQPGYYGNALQGTCKPCRCSQTGSANQQCDLATGQCQCKERFTGKLCDRCKNGFGNIGAGCLQCNCDPVGSDSTQVCSQETGQCECRPGVGGLTCNQCLDNHYGFSVNGCERCACNDLGSRSRSCDIISGQCQCKANVIGLTCDKCKDGYWGLLTGQGCQPCSCDPIGSLNGTCDANGYCYCRPGVGGQFCEQCLPGYFGFSANGCQECEKCDKPGHICDPDTGRCVCPPLTEGAQCQTCSAGAWNYNPVKGCQACNCHSQGSRSTQCNQSSGVCSCREGYHGTQCDRCQPGFYGFPNCLKCDCNSDGTDSKSCDSQGICQCGPDGQCPCKTNVQGRTCDRCKSSTFGIQKENADGCTPCYCFTRSTTCSQANYIWSQLRVEGGRGLMISYDHPLRPPNAISANQFPVNTQEICYINLALPGNQEMKFKAGETQLNVTNNLRIIPGQDGDVMIGVSQMFDTPLYWRLPEIFLKDKVLSYGGYIRFTIHNEGGSTLLPNNILATYPLVQIQGNRKLILEFYPAAVNPSGRYEVRLHESLWRMKNTPRGHVTREMFMITLQNLQHILIRATDSMDRSKASLADVSMDVAIPAPTNAVNLNLARGIEMCQCPEGYDATSCQDPSRGYYRRFKHDYISTTVIIELVGESHPCQCNGRSETCDKETGFCQNCRDNTVGRSCDQCAPGYYGDPRHGPCKPCACPSADRNFADSCELRNGTHKCACKKGYRGDRCQRCDYGYYGNPQSSSGFCQACNCDPNGSISDECDEVNGQCNCKPGITGRDCSYCAPRHVISPDGCTSCEEGCTGILFEDIDAMSRSISRISLDDFVPLPWNPLILQENTSLIFEVQLSERKRENSIRGMLINAPNLLPLAQILLQRIKESESQFVKLKSDVAHLNPRCSERYTEMIVIERIVQDIVAYLKNYAIGETPSINIIKAMNEAESHLTYIQSIDVNSRKANAQRELERSRKLLASVRSLIVDNSGVGNLRDHLEGFRIRLDDIDQNIAKSMNNSYTTFQSLLNSNITLSGIRHWISDISDKTSLIDVHLGAARSLNSNASLALSNSRVEFQSLKKSSVTLTNRTTVYKVLVDELSRSNPELESEYVTPAQQHANALWKQAQALFNQFNATRDVADLPLQAANAYKAIVDALRHARIAAEAASEAAETAYHEAYPPNLDLSLVERARMSREKSRDLLLQSERMKVVVSEHKERLKGERVLLNNIEVTLKKASTSIDDTSSALGKLVKVRDRAKAAVEKSSDALAKSTSTSRRVMNTSSLVESELRTRLLALQNNRDVGIGNLPKLIDETRKNLKSIDSKIMLLSKKQIENRSVNLTMNLKLDELRRKIMRAKQAASSIRVSLSGKGGGCSRTFSPTLQPSIMSSIMMTYAINHQDKDALLFYLPASKKHPNDAEIDFLALEMVNRQIRFLWNTGGTTTVLTNPLTLLPSPDDLSDDARWYKIEAERVGNVGSLTVRPVKLDDESLTQTQQRKANEFVTDDGGVKVTGAGPARYTKLDLTTGDTLYVGRVPRNPPADLKTSTFSGNMHQLWFDGQPIGLWNFNRSTSCAAAIEGAQETKDESSFHFNGQGYAELPQIPRYDSRHYSITFIFKSLDENALLFLAVNETVGQYISLELTEGLLRYEVRYGTNYELSLQSRKRYNTGQWVKVEAARVLLRGVETALLKVSDDEELSAAPFHFGVPQLELEDARLFIGGLPPNVQIPSSLMVSVPGSYLGCIKDLQVMAIGINPLQGSYYGVEASCSDSKNKIVAIPGHGYLQLRSPSPKKDFNMGFSFKTKSTDGILLYTFPIPTDYNDEPYGSLEDESNVISMALKADKDSDMFSISIRHGKLEARFKSGNSEVASVTSANMYNDDVFHNVVVMRTGKKVEVYVDDVSIGNVRLNRIANINQGDHSFLMVGGVRSEMSSTAYDFIGMQLSLTGCIADIMFNNELLDMSEPIKHQGVAVGRCSHIPAARNIEERMQANEKALVSCREVPQYTIEGRAVKFGDAPHSHVMITGNRKELQTSFNFTLDFRTHYPNGLLLYSSMKQKKKPSYFIVGLRNGRVVISVHGKRKEDVVSSTSVNDGYWHKVQIMKDKRKITLIVDEFNPMRAKAPNKLQLDGQIFIGGLPESLPLVDNSASEGFKGCIRNLNLNGRSYDLASSKNIIHRVGQCFAHVETGSYFPGDGYAIYSEDFRLGVMADIQLEFRTTELNGVLLSVSERKGSPSLSLSIDDGSVVFAVDMGDNHTFTVRQSFPSPYQVCDNLWHSIKVSYVENALTLKLDNLDEQYGFSPNDHVRESKARNPLFIGGLPEFEPQGTLRVRDNFKGCIRNVVIRGEIKDWTDMSRLHNVLLNACPIH